MLEFSKGLNGFFDSLIPPILRKTLKPNTVDHVRAGALAAMLYMTTLMLVFGVLIIVGHHLLFDPSLLARDVVSIAFVLLFAIQTVFFWRFGNQWLSGTIFVLTYFMLLAGLVIVSGGIESPMKTTLLAYPIMAYLIGGREEGFQGALITLLFVLGLTALSAIEFNLPNLIIEDNPRLIFTLNWVSALVIISFCLMVYESQLQNQYTLQKSQGVAKRNNMSRLSEPFDNFVRSLVPEQLRETPDAKCKDVARALILTVMLIMGGASSLVSSVILIGAHLVFHPDQLKYDWIIVGITMCFLLQMWFFYKFKNVVLSSYLLSYFYFMTILILIAITGGYDAPDMILLQISPIIFFMLGGVMNGIQNAVYVGIIGAAFSFLKQIEFQFINVFHAVSSTMIFGISWSIAVLAVAVCMIAYDEALQELG